MRQAKPGTGWEWGRATGEGLGFIRIMEVGLGAWVGVGQPRETQTLQVTVRPRSGWRSSLRFTEPAA